MEWQPAGLSGGPLEQGKLAFFLGSQATLIVLVTGAHSTTLSCLFLAMGTVLMNGTATSSDVC